MIPIKLALRNFMCYRDNVPPVSFESIHTACISGNNGNGKSALIDAMTWALWGKTRAASDDDLVHAGENEAEVQFDFALGRECYRVIRKRLKPKTRKGSGQTILEFQIATPEGFKALTGDTVTQTEHKIKQLLRMDYDTFINSAFLRQGHADEFTKKRAGERKEVLSNILQLSIYDELEDLAKEEARGQENLLAQIESAISAMQEELTHKPEYQAELEKAMSELAEVEKLSTKQEARLAELRKEKDTLENKKVQLSELIGNINDTERNYNLWKEQSQQHQARIKSFEELFAQRSLIEDKYNRLVEVRRECQELDQKFKQISLLTQAKHRLEMIIVKAGEDLNRAHAVAESRIHQMEVTADQLPHWRAEMESMTVQLRALADEETRLQDKKENCKLLRARMHFLQAEKARLVQEIDQVEEKIKMFAHQESATCPLCESELGPDGHKRIEAKYIAEKSGKNQYLKTNQTELSRKEEEVRTQESDILQSEARLKKAMEAAQSRQGTLSKSINDAQDAAEKIALEKKNLEELEERLARRDFAVSEQMGLEKIDREIADCGYDPHQHDLIRSELNQIEQFEAPMRKLEEADRAIGQEREADDRSTTTMQELRRKLENDNFKKQSMEEELNRFGQITADFIQVEKEYQELVERQKRVQQTLGGSQARLDRLADLEMRSKGKERERAEAARQEKIYQDLAQAFGKKGIQATLIEMAIPEIEAEANRLLARMTDNRMHVKIERQRETRKGDIMETLDINIADELGTRNYEMFSGGEAFRIDFAIRIALSRLLARRAGAPLPTLIVDEGFGTQDSSGIEKIKEAITSIQDDFEKILVITHIADFKDAFPVQIEVVKTSEGSTISLN